MKIKYVVNVMNYINKSFSLSKNISVSGNLINYDSNTKFCLQKQVFFIKL